jgi:hypothetical protein
MVKRMKIAALTWTGNNIGDDIQTVAVAQHLPHVDFLLRRGELNRYAGPECILVMNGWFKPELEDWPPSEAIRPIFFGFHVQERAREAMARHVDYLKRHEPIGCRDRGTMKLMKSLGVDAYLSLCATLTFEPSARRKPESLFLVDAKLDSIHHSIRRTHGLTSRIVSHSFGNVNTETRMAYAEQLISTYRETAGMVVTSRIHCAMPCVAMGIPVVYIGKKNSRTEIIQEIGLPLHDAESVTNRLGLAKIREWPEPLDIGAIKQRIRADLRSRIADVNKAAA